jgi:hypothetical protein
MRWVNRAVIAAALLCAGCGNYSTEDLEFLAALPQREDLGTAVPAGGTAGALTVGRAAVGDCPILGPANVWLEAKPGSDKLNAVIGFVVSLVDAVREHPPTWRSHEETYDERGWGPFQVEDHPGREIQVVMRRYYPDGPAGEPWYVYQFQARVTGTGAFSNLITGVFHGQSSARGKGAVYLDFEAFYALGMNRSDTPHGTMPILYDRTGEPRRTFLTLTQDGFGMPQAAYAYRGWQDGSGRFAYRYLDLTDGNSYAVVASYGSSGAGRGAFSVTTPAGLTGLFLQCWDADACIVFSQNVTWCATPPCSVGSELACPPVPELPEDEFPPVELPL